MPSQDTIAIVGGGTAGLCLAIGCLTKGVAIHIYEAAQAFTEIGGGVSFGPNSLRAMQLIAPSVWAGFSAGATNNAEHDKHKYFFRYRAGQEGGKVGRLICTVWNETGQTSVHRASMLDELAKEIPEGMATFGKRLENIEDRGDHVILHFKDGSSAQHAAVMCCDGVKSKARQILFGEHNPMAKAVYSGEYCYRGLVQTEQALKVLGKDIAGNSSIYVGKGGHILMYPIEKGKTMNVIAYVSAKSWDSPEWVKPATKEDMRRDFAGWVEGVQEVFSLMQKPDVWALFDMPPADTYFRNRICLLGDAAHASTPHQGAGAGMAIEDALVMPNLLEGLGSEGIPKAFEVFDAVRRPRTQKLVSTSREAGQLYDLELPGVEDNLELLAENLSSRYKWIWDFDLEAHVEEAKAMLRTKLSVS